MIFSSYYNWHVHVFSTSIPSQLTGWRASPSSQPLGSLYVKLFGQEVGFGNIDKAVLDQVIEVNLLCLFYIRISNIHFSTTTISDIVWDIFSSLPAILRPPLRAERLLKPCCLVWRCTGSNPCWWLRCVASFPPPWVFPWKLASTRLEWLLQHLNVNTTIV